jgi:hypothetical protein
MRGLYKHTPTAKLVYITSGEYEYDGRVSNHYSGFVIDKDGYQTNEIFGDYNNENGKWVKIENYKIKIIYDLQ